VTEIYVGVGALSDNGKHKKTSKKTVEKANKKEEKKISHNNVLIGPIYIRLLR
jgi:hypothetical protein